MSETAPVFPEASGPASPYFGVTGDQAGQARQKDAEVKRLRQFRTNPSSPEYQQLLEAFKASPATGCTTVLDLLRRKAGYSPTDLNPYRLTMFYVELMQSPLFSPLPFDAFEFEIKVGMGEPALDPDAIIRRYHGSDGEASRRIREQYDRTITEALSHRGTTQKAELLQEHSLGVRSRITFLYIRTSLHANLNMLPGMMILIGVVGGGRHGMEFAFETAKWPNYADAVLKEHLKTLDDWLDGL